LSLEAGLANTEHTHQHDDAAPFELSGAARQAKQAKPSTKPGKRPSRFTGTLPDARPSTPNTPSTPVESAAPPRAPTPDGKPVRVAVGGLAERSPANRVPSDWDYSPREWADAAVGGAGPGIEGRLVVIDGRYCINTGYSTGRGPGGQSDGLRDVNQQLRMGEALPSANAQRSNTREEQSYDGWSWRNE
jgi:hypothetical protein